MLDLPDAYVIARGIFAIGIPVFMHSLLPSPHMSPSLNQDDVSLHHCKLALLSKVPLRPVSSVYIRVVEKM